MQTNPRPRASPELPPFSNLLLPPSPRTSTAANVHPRPRKGYQHDALFAVNKVELRGARKVATATPGCAPPSPPPFACGATVMFAPAPSVVVWPQRRISCAFFTCPGPPILRGWRRLFSTSCPAVGFRVYALRQLQRAVRLERAEANGHKPSCVQRVRPRIWVMCELTGGCLCCRASRRGFLRGRRSSVCLEG